LFPGNNLTTLIAKPAVRLKLGTILLYCVIPLYIVLSLSLFFLWVNPSLTGENQQHIAADSTRYMYFAESLSEGQNDPFVLAAMASFPNTLWAPVFIGMLLHGNTVAIVILNYALLLLSVWVLRKAVNMNTGLFLLLLFANATTSISLLSLNKEIVDIFVTALFVYYLGRGRRIVLFAALLIAVINRYETAIVIVMYLVLQSRWNPFRNWRKFSLVAVCVGLSIFLSGVIASAMSARFQEALDTANNSGILVLLDTLQMHYLFFLAVIPKILDNLFSELVYVSHWQAYSLDDPANSFFLFGNNLASLGVIVFLILRGRFTLRHNLVYYAVLSAIFMSTALIIQPRYFYGAYCVLCVEGARRYMRRSPTSHGVRSIPYLEAEPIHS
jgi:hypothetical protein